MEEHKAKLFVEYQVSMIQMLIERSQLPIVGTKNVEKRKQIDKRLEHIKNCIVETFR